MASEHDLKGLMKFAEREEWHKCFGAVMEAHFGAILDAGDIEFEDIIDLVGGHWQGILWGCAFEDFLTLEFDIPGENIVDEYLKRRGWWEKSPAKEYMKALRGSVLSLYEVSDVMPGKSMKLRDLVRGGEPVTIIEQSATQSLKQWDRIATRVVEIRGKTIMSGGVLPFSFKASDVLFNDLKETLGYKKPDKLENIADEELQHLAPLFTLSWLSGVLESVAFREDPSLSNSEGEAIEFHDMRFPFVSGVTQKQIASRLNELSDLEQEDAKFWNWLERGKKPGKTPAGNNTQGLFLKATFGDGSRVLGNIELKGKSLIFSVNSADRAKRGQELMENMLGALVRSPLTEIRTIKQMLEDTPDSPEQNPESDIPPEIAEQLMKQTLDKHYRETIDLPVPALGNKTPRQAVKTKAGREQVIEWLKYLENSSGKPADPDDLMASYDFSWIWKELGIER